MGAELEGRTALITGESRGLGRAMAEHFARHGARVAVLDLKQPWAQATADEIVAYGGIAHALDETIVR